MSHRHTLIRARARVDACLLLPMLRRTLATRPPVEARSAGSAFASSKRRTTARCPNSAAQPSALTPVLLWRLPSRSHFGNLASLRARAQRVPAG